ncbi:MAG: hypothetical protein H6735_01395 [Alphaproteobacteria bacterium]|nr:hypothetical protein [Alphaproteobacteria bacterium]
MLWWLMSCAGGERPCDDCIDEDQVDHDGDGALAGVDCDDLHAELNVDDVDGDGFSTCQGDCDDDDPLRGPRGVVAETCDNIDNDCNDVVDVDDLGWSPCQVEDTYALPWNRKLDVLIVVESTSTFQTFGDLLVQAGRPFLEPLVGRDVHLGVISTRPGTGELQGPSGRPWLDLREVDIDTAVGWYEVAVDRTAPQQGTSVPLLNATKVIDGVDLLSNAGFRRDDAALTFLFASDQDDESPGSAEDFVEWLAFSLHARFDAHVYGILPTPDGTCGSVTTSAPRLEDVLARTEPVIDDLLPVCTVGYGAGLNALALTEQPPFELRFALDQLPIPTTIEVELTHGGRTEVRPYAAITYLPDDNEIVVADLGWPDLEEAPHIRYQVLPDAR